jgi:hypothetical protein
MLKLPAIQKRLVVIAANKISEYIQYPISISGISIKWTSQIVLEDVYVHDTHHEKMIEIKEAQVNFNWFSLLGKNIVVKNIHIIKPKVNLKWYADIDDINIANFISKLQSIGKDTSIKIDSQSLKLPKKYTKFIVKNVEITEGYLTYIDNKTKKLVDRFDFGNFEIDSIYLNASQFSLIADTISMQFKGLKCNDRFSKLKIKNLDARFGICENYMKLQDLDATIGKSKIKHTVVLEYDSYRQLSEIEDSVKMTLKLNNSSINSEDLAVFLPEMHNFNEVWNVDGEINGYFNNFKAKNLYLKWGKNSHWKGSAEMKGLPNWEKTWMNLNFVEAQTNYLDLKKYGLKDVYPELRLFQNAYMKGVFVGLSSDFTANLNFKTNLGDFETEMKVKTPQNEFKGSYLGFVKLHNFNPTSFTGIQELEKVNGNLKIDGKGFQFNHLDLSLNVSFENLSYKKYEYKNIISKLIIRNKKFLINLDIQDSNLVANLNANYNTNSKEKNLQLELNIFKTNLQALKIYGNPLNISSKLNVSMKHFGKNISYLDLKATDINLGNAYNKIFADKIKLLQDKTSNNLIKLSLESPFIDAELLGNFNLLDVIPASKKLFQNFANHLTSNQKTPMVENTILPQKGKNLNYNVFLKDTKGLTAIFLPNFSFSNQSKINGSLDFSENQLFSISALSDTFKYNNLAFTKAIFNFDFYKNINKNQFEGKAEFTSENQFNNNTKILEKLLINTELINNEIDFIFKTQQSQNTNEAQLIGNLTLGENKTLKFEQSTIKILDNLWKVDAENEILFTKNEVLFNHVNLTNGSQELAIKGKFARNSNETATIKITNFDMSSLNIISIKKLNGILNANIILNDFFRQLKVSSEVDIAKFQMDKLLIGNIKGSSDWDAVSKKINISMNLERWGNKIISINGFYLPEESDQNQKLNLVAVLNKARVEVFQPILDGSISELKGEATGRINISGNFQKPLLNGEVEIENGSMKIDYMNTTYLFNEKIKFYPNKIELSNFLLQDLQGGLAVINGGLTHENFKKFNLDLKGDFRKCIILETTSKNNELFYGTAIGTGNFIINSDFKVFNLEMNITSNKGTKFYIPINNSFVESNNEFITFIQKNNLNATTNKRKKINLNSANGLKMNLNLLVNITPDAYLELILDPIAGDKITGFGNGNMQINFNSESEFKLTGQYAFKNPSNYIFTFANLVNKKFNINDGSFITFNGDPLEGQIDISAAYNDRISLASLVTDTSLLSRPGIRTPYPVSTLLFLKGNLLKPVISYDIKIKDYPSVISGVPLFNYVSAFENKIRNNVNEMNIQVFSLLLFRSFIASTDDISGNQAAGSTISELVSNQLSNLVSKLDENLQVDFRLNGLNRDALSAAQLRVSYKLLDGKIRITRSGAFTNSQSQATAASIAGDWTIEYLLTNDGKFKVKAFSKNNPNMLSVNNSSSYNLSTGVSLAHTASFNSLNPFNRKKKKPRKTNKVK